MRFNETQKRMFVVARKGFSAALLFFLVISFSFVPFSSQNASAATGDITTVAIASSAAYSGWVAEVTIDGLSTGGTYDFGFGDNNDPTNAKMVFTVTSEGYDDAGEETTITRTVYGTYFVRKVYPDNAEANETDNGSSVTIRVALSDYIYASDTVTVTMDEGVYSEGGNDSAAVTDLAVTNNSTEAYPRVIANWSWPGYSLVTGDTLTLRAVAFHRSAQQGRPVRAVKFTCEDESANSASSTVTVPIVDDTINDAVPVVEYVGTVSMAALTNGDTVTCNFEAYPWYGDANAVLNTGDGVHTMPTPLYAPQYYLLDKGNTYGRTVAVVDVSGGNNGTGAVVDAGAFDSENPPDAFQNIYAAVNAIAAYNNSNYSRNDTGGGVVYLQEGSHEFSGGTVTAGGQAGSVPWLTITRFPGTTRANVILATASDTKQANEHLKIDGITITNSTTIAFTGMDAVWTHDTVIDEAGIATYAINTVMYFTNSTFYDIDELEPFVSVDAARALVRGNQSAETMSTGVKSAYTVLGNDIDFTGGAFIIGNYDSSAMPAVSGAIYAFNFISQSSASTAVIEHFDATLANTTGTAVIQNVFERVSGTSSPLFQIAADQSTSNPVNNTLIWYNSVVGQRTNMAYNDYNLNDGAPAYRKHWSVKGNIFDDYNTVTDIQPHGGTANGSRYGNHSLVHGTGLSGNVYLERTGVEGVIGDFIGVNTVLGSALDPEYVNDESVLGDGGGNGDYHLTASSPALGLIASSSSMLPYDITGSARHDNGYGAAGAYEWDVSAPTVTGFVIPATANALTVDITTFTASDAVGVTGYQVTESSTAPPWDSVNWSGSATTTYTFTSAGSKTLYAWAKDAVGNVSASATDAVTVTLPTYTVGGTVSGLAGTVVLQNNGGDDLSVSASGSFTFDTSLADAAAYSVAVLTQPSGQTCAVSNGSGTIATANVTNAVVTCTNNSSESEDEDDNSGSGGGGCGGCSALPVQPARGFGVQINDGSLVTSLRNVELRFSAGADVKKIAISMTGDFTDAAQEVYAPVKQWDLCSRFGGLVKASVCLDGLYTISVRFYTAWGWTSESAFASSAITLKTDGSEHVEMDDTEEEAAEATPPLPTPPGATPPTTTSSFPFTRDLFIGDRGADVRALQQALNASGFLLASEGLGSPGSETDFFGILTRNALTRFQEAYATQILVPAGLSRGTGYFGPSTRAFLQGVTASGTTPASTPRPLLFTRPLTIGAVGEDVRALQDRLRVRNTGYFGPLTQQAVQRFQLEQGIVSSSSDVGYGYVGPKTREVLNGLAP